MKPKFFPYKEFVSIYSRVPRFCVDLIIQTKEGIVLSKRHIIPYKGYWHLPGGTVLFKETVEQTAKRVALDETGLTIKIIKELGTMQYIRGKGRHSISVGLLVTPIKGTLKGSKQGQDIRYFSKLPAKTIQIQSKFLLANKLIKK